MQYKVEKGIEMPRARNGHKKAHGGYPFPDMKKGDSFIASKDVKMFMKIAGHASNYSISKNREVKFSLRTTPEGIRVWRTK